MQNIPAKEAILPNALFSLNHPWKNPKFNHFTENKSLMLLIQDSLKVCVIEKPGLQIGYSYSDLTLNGDWQDVSQEGPLETASLSSVMNVLCLFFKSRKLLFVEILRRSGREKDWEFRRLGMSLKLDRIGPSEWSRGAFYHVSKSQVFKVDFKGYLTLQESAKELNLQNMTDSPLLFAWTQFYDFKDPIVDFSASQVHRLFYFLGKRSLVKIVNQNGTLLHRKSLYSQPRPQLISPAIIVPVVLADAVRIKSLICVPRKDVPTIDPLRDYDISYRDFIFVFRLSGVAEVYKISHLKKANAPEPVFSHQLMGPPQNADLLRFVVDPLQNFFTVRCLASKKLFVYKITKHFSRYNKSPHDKSNFC